MDALLRDQQRQKEAQGQYRPPLASQTNKVIDLTNEDAFGPIPSSSQSSSVASHNSPQGKGNYIRPPAKGANGWQLSGRSKHSGPPKVKMLDESMMYSAARPFPFGSSSQPTSGSARPQHVSKTTQPHLNGSSLNVYSVHASKLATQTIDADNDVLDDDDDDDYEPSPQPSFAYAEVSAAEREQQLQDMLSSMVNPVEASDIDYETAKKVAGLKCDLMPHQVAGVMWMKEREGGRYKGGILADDMGLGKTVQTLALIVSNSATSADRTIDTIRQVPSEMSKKKKGAPVVSDAPPEKIDLKSKTTLILAPLAVIRQWEREANEKTKPALRVLVHHGAGRAKMPATFAKYDIVVTTYTTAASEWTNHTGGSAKKKRKSKAKKTIESDSEDESGSSFHSDTSEDEAVTRKPVAAAKRAPAPLFEAQWLRIVLDEAQNIKNHRTKASIACAALAQKALSKWCLSGTPIQNDALEMFSLIRFLDIPPLNYYALFKDKISDPLKSANQNRVTWGMKRLCAILRTIMLRRTKETTHDGKPLITLPTRTVNIVSSDFDNENEKTFYQDLESQVKKRIEDAEEGGQKVTQMATLLMLLRLRQACSHPSLLYRHVKTDAAAASAPVVSGQNGFSAMNGANDDDDDGLADLLAGLSVVTKSCERCQVTLAKDEAQEKHCSDCKRAVENEKRKGINWIGESSTKIRLMLKLLEDIRKTSNGEKTIVFSQFTSFLDLVEPFLQKEKHKYVRYDGSMRADERERNLEKIRNDDNTKIILISFMAGSTGLNLTCCSRVILMDLWWNPQLEEQAFDRSHRLGQTKPVQIYKLTINKSVEERILELQAKKRALAKAALEGSKYSKANKLDKKEMAYLFSGQI